MKNIHLKAYHLGAIKQAPYIIKSLQEIMPDVSIKLYLDNDTHHCYYTREILKSDLDYQGIEKRLIDFEPKNLICDIKEDKKNMIIHLDFFWSSYEKNFFELWIDPLKFENRRLLDKQEVQKMKEHYRIDADNIILGGSLHDNEADIFLDATQKLISKNKHAQVIIVPRYNNAYFLDKFKTKKIAFRTDKEPKGKGNYLFITQYGILDKLYALCDTAILGDTFNKGHGQNPLEPAFYGKRIISGKFADSMNKKAYGGLHESGLLKVVNPSKLKKELLREYPENELKEWRLKAQKFIKAHQGYAKIYAQLVKDAFEKNLSNAKLREKISKVNQRFSL